LEKKSHESPLVVVSERGRSICKPRKVRNFFSKTLKRLDLFIGQTRSVWKSHCQRRWEPCMVSQNMILFIKS